ncbi:hypothetical protein PCASD_08998 [Puccinia coronata f. sp. avenae]|uniref:Uncharacterized protein n=1 Tax=Puccinia coronata f. sp. avenae TaxID=200324 RepID=A0A2N5UL20_9BASI|nr:hypothetical protein PCASD_08998 [Puccinia coronata f. sp. avenae]
MLNYNTTPSQTVSSLVSNLPQDTRMNQPVARLPEASAATAFTRTSDGAGESQSDTECDEISPWSSNLSSPSSGSRSSPLTPQQRRQGSTFAKITVRTNEFSEERFVYSHSIQGLDACLESTLGEKEEVDASGAPPFFAIPTTRYPVSTQADTPHERREDRPSGSIGGGNSSSRCKTSSTTATSADKRHSGCSFLDALIVALHDRTKPLPTLPGWEEELDDLLALQNDPYWTEVCTPDLGTDDSIPLGHYPGALPSSLKRSPARAKGLTRRKKLNESASGLPTFCPCGCNFKRRSRPRSHIIHPAIIASRADFQYWNAILDGRIMP